MEEHSKLQTHTLWEYRALIKFKDHKTISQVKGFNSWVYSVTFSTSKTKVCLFQQEVSPCSECKDKEEIEVNMRVDEELL